MIVWLAARSLSGTHHTYLDASKTAWLLAGNGDYESPVQQLGGRLRGKIDDSAWETGDRPF